VRIETLADNPSLREQLKGLENGVFVHTIESDAPAYKSDLRPDDVITAVDGVPVAAARDLQREIVHKKIGQTVQLSVWRAGKSLQIPVTTGELPASFTRVSAPPAPKKDGSKAE
jgi:S1-C subfamily serine protease